MKVRLLLALGVCGCTSLVGARTPGSGAPGFLWGAGEDVTIIAQPEEEEVEAAPAVEEVAEEKTGMFGVRAGMFAPDGNQTGYDSYGPGLLVGAFYRGLQLAEKSLAWEVGAESASASPNELDENASLFRLRASILYGKWYSESSTRFFFSGGGGILLEGGAKGGEAIVGAGIAFGKLDLRLEGSFLIGSENASSVTTAALGYSF